MDLGREGANERARAARQRAIAIQMAEAECITVEKTAAIVKKSVEVQEKANAARVAARTASKPATPRARKRPRRIVVTIIPTELATQGAVTTTRSVALNLPPAYRTTHSNPTVAGDAGLGDPQHH